MRAGDVLFCDGRSRENVWEVEEDRGKVVSVVEEFMAVVVDEGTAMGVLFEGEEELLLLENLVEWAVVTTQSVGVPAHVLCGWAGLIQSARGSNPRDEEEEEEEIRILLANGMEQKKIFQPTICDPAGTGMLAQVMEILPMMDNSMRDAVEARRVGV